MSYHLLLLLASVGMAADSPPEPGFAEVPRLNAGLPRLDPPVDLATPQSMLESFLDSADRGDYLRAAHSLNLNAIPVDRQRSAGPDLAHRLHDVMREQVWFDWEAVPDRPDGKDDRDQDRPNFGGQDPRPPEPRSNIRLYTLYLGDHDYEIRLERLKPGQGEPAWVFSAQTVANVPLLHDEFGPSRLERAFPSWVRDTRLFKIAIWQWAGFVLIILAGVLLGRAVERGLDAITSRIDSPRGKAIAEAVRGPGALTIGLWIFHELTGRFLGLARPITSILEPFYLALMIASLVWFLRRLIAQISARFGRRYEALDNEQGNVRVTRLAFARHALTFLVILIGALVILGRFEWFRQVGLTLLASAGVAGVVLGVAAQRVLGNIFAGLLLAVTQPVKSGDAILFEEEFGWIEEIDLTYLVIRTWDLRRLVVPISYLLDRPFQNWSRKSQQIMKAVIVHADYRVDVEAVRAEVGRILDSLPDYDHEVPPILQVVDCNPETVELRALCSASDPTSSWNLHCELRERMIAFLRDHEGGRFLPRIRLERVDEDFDEPDPSRTPPEQPHESSNGRSGRARAPKAPEERA